MESSTKAEPKKPEATALTGSETEVEPVDETSSQTDSSKGAGVMKCEIKHLDSRYDDKDEQFFEERKGEVTKPQQKDWWRLFAFCVVRQFNNYDDLEHTRLYVNPQPLRQLLKDVIGNYYSDPINVNDVQIAMPYYSLFYHRQQLEEIGRERFKEDEESMSQLNLLLEWVQTHFKPDIEAYDLCVSGEVKAITYEHLWTLFAPKTIVHSKILEQHRAFRVFSSWYDLSEVPGFNIVTYYTDYDGEKPGERKTELFIPKYRGNRDLRSLEVRPLDLHEDAEEVREYLLARGRKFESYIGQHFEKYDGIAVKKTDRGYARVNIQGRIVSV